MKDPFPYIQRDISWLSFNYRVLQEAKDPNVPLLERIKFLAIYSNNLDEFFRVRVANHKALLRLGKKTQKELDFDPKEVLQQLLKIVNAQHEEFSEIFEDQIVPALKEEGIHLLRRQKLNTEQIQFIESFFNDNCLPFVQPVLLVGDKIKPFLNNASLYLALVMKPKEPTGNKYEYAIVNIPSDSLPRFVELPSKTPGRKDLIMLDDIVRHSIRNIFPGYEIKDSFSIKLTRDAELYIDDEYEGDLILKIKKSIAKRDVGITSRFVYDSKMPNHFIEYLMHVFELDELDLLREGRYHNNFDFFKFPNYGYHHLQEMPLPPLPYTPLEQAEDFFKAIREDEHMVYFPFHSYESVVRFFEEAAVDPDVTHIKIIQYRVSKISRIMDALMRAVNNGKQVSAFIEVKARFDEEANLNWGEKLEKAGVSVYYSMPGLKVHAKMAIIRRMEDGEASHYAYMSTGNFHEDTARIYTDFGFFTADKKLIDEVIRIFTYLETKIPIEKKFEHLGVGQHNLKPLLISLVQHEIDNAKKGKPARMILKMNSLQDKEMVQLLYDASKAGVQVDMIIRGICCIVPNIKGISDNINIISIVDRFLEHSRVFYFLHSGEEVIYISSADWMVRNLHYRIESMFPVYNPDFKEMVKTILKIQLNDNTKARIIDHKSSNVYKRNDSLPARSQVDTYYYIKRLGEKQEEQHDENVME